MANKKSTKYIFVVGGVMSGVGKGVTTASIAKILQSKGFKVSVLKADPYLNVDAGTMNPTEHGEVFVLDSGLECDQDMGNYERFLDVSLPEDNYMTNGMIFKHVIDKERALGYKGKCVEPIYHITEEILRRIKTSAQKTNAEITLIEIGGTIGEYQNAIFIEAARVLRIKNIKDVMTVMVSYLPVPQTIGEMKTKPTQNAVRQLNSYGVTPDLIIARSSYPLDAKRKDKIADSTGIEAKDVISAPDIESIYDVPINFENDALSTRILSHFGLRPRQKDLKEWRAMVAKMKKADKPVKIAIVGKYFDTGDFILSDAYISVIEAIKFSSYGIGVKPDIHWLSSKDFESDDKKLSNLKDYDGIIVPGGFGETGIEGKINVIQYARENKIPYFGLCYGMQLMVIEYARHVLGIETAHTVEIDPDTPNPVIDIMPDQKKKLAEKDYGGSMRLGGYQALLKKGTIAYKAYGKGEIRERHRHRYEVNPEYIEKLSSRDLIFSGVSPDGTLMEIAELPTKIHPFFLGVQFHPEFLARPLSPHPLFSAFIKASLGRSTKNKS
ncbi:CTP synthetase [Candidatus Campbellbacteria bacterium CG22_combo_CG10-13_8_21_14_all_36_13]|uniref:CTP synthase n=1 Tax=Candidatus Campbellbacteria bacterium CG22_combo_CG10-13_8_21_14_all_36_13 TaxID=1974529 RepID=A0A2H0DYV3_9BACT|nr:MAG: CTP synthetase [Candidatus Campbellbacteria bacterium CG22_combo_CG10-13_8_21_14_all_36_13]